MNTSTLLRQAMHELLSAYDEAAHEYGTDSKQFDAIEDAVAFMDSWPRRYSASLHKDVWNHHHSDE